MKVDKVVSTILSIAVAGIFSIPFILQGHNTYGGGILVGAGIVVLMFVLQDSFRTFTKGTEIELASRSLFALAAILVGLYVLV